MCRNLAQAHAARAAVGEAMLWRAVEIDLFDAGDRLQAARAAAARGGAASGEPPRAGASGAGR